MFDIRYSAQKISIYSIVVSAALFTACNDSEVKGPGCCSSSSSAGSFSVSINSLTQAAPLNVTVTSCEINHVITCTINCAIIQVGLPPVAGVGCSFTRTQVCSTGSISSFETFAQTACTGVGPQQYEYSVVCTDQTSGDVLTTTDLPLSCYSSE